MCIRVYSGRQQDVNRMTVKGVEELVNEFTTVGHSAGFMSCMIAILYFLSIYGLEKLGSSTVWKAGYRGIFADYAYVVSSNPPKDLSPVGHLLISSVLYYILGWLLAHSRNSQIHPHQLRSHYSRFLSDPKPQLAHSVLGTGY